MQYSTINVNEGIIIRNHPKSGRNLGKLYIRRAVDNAKPRVAAYKITSEACKSEKTLLYFATIIHETSTNRIRNMVSIKAMFNPGLAGTMEPYCGGLSGYIYFKIGE
jgi:hypothetical protein